MSGSEPVVPAPPEGCPRRSSTEVAVVVGGGYMGGGIARTLASYGVPTTLVDADEATAVRRVAELHTEARAHAELGLIDAESAAAVATHLVAAASVGQAVVGATYVAEAVPELPAVKRAVLEEVSALVGPEVVIGTNTSAIPIRDLAAWVARPERFLGVHWMNPAPYVPGVELIPGPTTGADALARAAELMRSVGKVATEVGDAPGFVANRLQFALLREAVRLVEEGVATPEAVDEVVTGSFGYRLPFFGPFAIADIAGLDVYRDTFATLEAAHGERLGTPALLRRLVAEGRLGLKSGRGFHDFSGTGAQVVADHRDRAYAGLRDLRDRLGRLRLSPDET